MVTASGGNHGAAVAYVARALGLPAEVFVPEVTAPAKVERIRSYGAKVIVGGARYDDARLACEARAAQTGALLVHAFDHPDVVAGQGTVGLELARQAHRAFPDRIMVGWDVAMLKDGPMIVEGNGKPDLDIHQRVERAPLGKSRVAELIVFNLRKHVPHKLD